MIPNPLLRKLERFEPLSEADKAVVERASRHARTVEARTDLIREGNKPADVRLILDGFACRYKLLPDGGRQILAYLVPGDFCDLHVFILSEMDHSIATLSPCLVADIPREMILEMTEQHPKIARALWWATLVDEAVLREWLAGMGRRDASQQVAHLFCEMLVRLQTVGFATENSYELPVSQIELADTVGLSNVHVNRTLQELRAQGLIVLKGKSLVIPDVDRLKRFGEFNPNYLHLGPAPRSARGQNAEEVERQTA